MNKKKFKCKKRPLLFPLITDERATDTDDVAPPPLPKRGEAPPFGATC